MKKLLRKSVGREMNKEFGIIQSQCTTIDCPLFKIWSKVRLGLKLKLMLFLLDK